MLCWSREVNWWTQVINWKKNLKLWFDWLSHIKICSIFVVVVIVVTLPTVVCFIYTLNSNDRCCRPTIHNWYLCDLSIVQKTYIHLLWASINCISSCGIKIKLIGDMARLQQWGRIPLRILCTIIYSLYRSGWICEIFRGDERLQFINESCFHSNNIDANRKIRIQVCDWCNVRFVVLYESHVWSLLYD